jgi:hypothetical protein
VCVVPLSADNSSLMDIGDNIMDRDRVRCVSLRVLWWIMPSKAIRLRSGRYLIVWMARCRRG